MDKGCMAKAHCTLPRELERLTAENERLQQEFIDRAGDKAMERITQLTAEIRQKDEYIAILEAGSNKRRAVMDRALAEISEWQLLVEEVFEYANPSDEHIECFGRLARVSGRQNAQS